MKFKNKQIQKCWVAHILEKIHNIHEELKHQHVVLKIPYKKFSLIKIKFSLKKIKKLGSLSYDTCIEKTHIISFLMLLLSSKNISCI